jgi:alpha-maltose-1-phosphate synthase
MNARVISALVGDIQNEPFARVKYGHFYAALAKQLDLLAVCDATLRGPWRILNLIQTYHPDRVRWRERFYKNLSAFSLRSARVRSFERGWQGKAGVYLQVGAMFDGTRAGLPALIYTDYTAALSARHPDIGRSPFTPQQRKRWMALEQAVYANAALICTRSRETRMSVIADYGIPSEKISVVGGGVNFATLPAVPTRQGRAPITLLFIGKDLHRKGGDLLLAAFAKLRKKTPDLRLKMVTDGPVSPLADLSGVEIIPSTWDRAVIAGLYEQADIFVLPSRLETWGDVLLEAMAYGIPCVGVRGQAMEEIIGHGVDGWLVDPEDPAALAKGIARLVEDERFRLQCGEAARRKVEREFTWEMVAGRIAGVVRDISASLPDPR